MVQAEGSGSGTSETLARDAYREDEAGGEFDFFSAISRFGKHWRLAACCVVVGLVLGVIYLMTTPSIYTAEVSIIPQNRASASVGLIGQLAGIDLMTNDGTSEHEAYYEKIVRSDRILDVLIGRRWHHIDHEDSVSLFTVFGIPKTDDVVDARAATATLKQALRAKVIDFDKDKMTGFMLLRASVPDDPVLAADLANEVVRQLEIYNLKVHQHHSAAVRRFVEERLAEAKLDLAAAEERLTDYVASNRNYTDSPMTLEAYRKLDREVSAEMAVWSDLRRQFELASIEERKTLPSVEVLDLAQPPAMRAWPRAMVVLVLALACGAGLAVVAIIGLELVAELRKKAQARSAESSG